LVFFLYIIKWNNRKLNSAVLVIKERILNGYVKIQVDRTLNSRDIMSTQLKNTVLRKMHLKFQLRFTNRLIVNNNLQLLALIIYFHYQLPKMQ